MLVNVRCTPGVHVLRVSQSNTSVNCIRSFAVLITNTKSQQNTLYLDMVQRLLGALALKQTGDQRRKKAKFPLIDVVVRQRSVSSAAYHRPVNTEYNVCVYI